MLALAAAIVLAAQVAAPTPAPLVARRLMRIAVYDVESVDFPKRVTSVVTEALLVEIRKLEGVSVVGLDEVRALLELEANRQLVGCSDASCLSEVAGALGADVVVIGTLAKVGNGSVFGARRLDQKNAQVSAQVSQRLADANGEEFIAAVGAVVEQLFADIPLRAGETRGADAELALRVNPPPLSPAVFWCTAAATGAVASAAVVLGAINLVAAQTYAGQTSAVQGKDVVRNQAQVRATAIGFYAGLGLTTVGAATAGVEALFTDWWDYGAEPGSQGKSE